LGDPADGQSHLVAPSLVIRIAQYGKQVASDSSFQGVAPEQLECRIETFSAIPLDLLEVLPESVIVFRLAKCPRHLKAAGDDLIETEFGHGYDLMS
jgi:hypothetical protein